MASKKKLLQAAAGTGGGNVVNVDDVFSAYAYTGTGGSQTIENGINLGQSYGSGGIYFPDGDGDYLQTESISQFTGAFTFELWFWSNDDNRAIYLIDKGDRDTNFSISTNYLGDDQLFVKVAGTSLNYSSAGLNVDDWNHIAVVRDSSNNVATFVNGTRAAATSTISGTVTAGAYYIGGPSTGASASGYELMYGYMSSIRISDTDRYSTSSTSITEPTSVFTSDSNTVLLLGQGDTPLTDESSNSYSITVNGFLRASNVGPHDAADSGEGGMVWLKNRSTSDGYFLFDTERGATKRLRTHTNAAELTDTASLTSFNADGFTIGDNVSLNNTNNLFASWTFRKAPKFFDVVTYTGNGTAGRTVSHNLGSVPGAIIVKAVNAVRNWPVYHRKMHGTLPADYKLTLDESAGRVNSANIWNDTLPTATEFTVGTDGETNNNGTNYIAFIFAHNDGDGEFGPNGDLDIIKCDTYTGDGTTDGSKLVDVGFEPQWVLIRNIGAVENWLVIDNIRGSSVGATEVLFPNLTQGASGAGNEIHSLDPKGFRLGKNNTDSNDNGANYLYIAIRRSTAEPTNATDVFDVFTTVAADSEGIYGTVGPVDLNVNKKTDTAYGWRVLDRIRNDYQLQFNATSSDNARDWVDFDNMYGIEITSTGAAYLLSNSQVHYNWKRATGFFDIVTYKGNGTAGNTINHNLGVVPEMMIVKKRSSIGDWLVYHSGIDSTAPEDYRISLNSTAARNNNADAWNDTAPTDTVFSLGTSGDTNDSGVSYIAYLFASVDGISKLGSYTGTGAALDVDCGFSNGARFVMIKRADGTASWEVWDTERGIVTGSEPRLKLNTDAAEATTDWLDPYSGGFQVSALGPNAVGGNYIFYAIA